MLITVLNATKFLQHVDGLAAQSQAPLVPFAVLVKRQVVGLAYNVLTLCEKNCCRCVAGFRCLRRFIVALQLCWRAAVTVYYCIPKGH